MKKIAILSVGLALAMSLSACGNTAPESSTASNTAAQTSAAANADSTDAATDSSADTTEQTDTNVLVVYYSATGSTEKAANAIADATGGDLFTIEPVEPYTSDDLDWTNSKSRVSVEHDDPDQRDVELVSTTVDNWDSYDTVFIGYPIWWGIAAWPVDGFVTANDFTGKTVIPFCTSASSGLGDSGSLLEEMAGSGNWQEGQRFSSGESADTITQWAKDIINN